jgi:hypothetical protein
MYWLPRSAKEIVTHSLPHYENDGQWGVNDSWSRILGSVCNSSKLAVQFQVRVGTELELFQQVVPNQQSEPH